VSDTFVITLLNKHTCLSAYKLSFILTFTFTTDNDKNQREATALF